MTSTYTNTQHIQSKVIEFCDKMHILVGNHPAEVEFEDLKQKQIEEMFGLVAQHIEFINMLAESK